jgi:hypothetical protein
MSRTQTAHVIPWPGTPAAPPMSLVRLRETLAVDARSPESLSASLPFAPGDVTAGVENELQVAVRGSAGTVDLATTLQNSSYVENLRRMTAAGDISPRSLGALEAFLADNTAQVWENSWVRFPRARLNPLALAVFEGDLRADKRLSNGPLRQDCGRFTCVRQGEPHLRVPISYLLKLALAEAAGAERTPPLVRHEARQLLEHFLSDNTSPETFSFHTPFMEAGPGCGEAIAAETAKRHLLSQLLILYANQRFGLLDSGQEALLYQAPHPPLRQRRLNDLIPDAFYRELFMSPCLSGWDCGEEKHRYMILCHQVLSRSQLHAVKKLKEAGIITSDLVVLPNLSNISLANNGTHLSLGSRKLSRSLADPASAFGAAEEKRLGDLVIKIVEHFLPLFVGTYSAAPYRLDFGDFHPEKALGFLPHELNFTHLRMLWRRWKKKARIGILGRPVTPFGPEWLDRLVSRVFALKGDWVPDFRLIDYLVCLLSTRRSPALNGLAGSDVALKQDLAAMGVFDPAMSLYLLYRLRRFEERGFSGFEGRHYSLFPSFREDMAPAAALQTLITALAYQYVLTGTVQAEDIPDSPALESERRQIFFASAMGVPTVYVEARSANRFLRRILAHVRDTRASRRYPGYTRIPVAAYARGLVCTLHQDGAGLIEAYGLRTQLDDLEGRLQNPDHGSAAGRLTRAILAEAGARSPFQLRGVEFNAAAEAFYRQDLRRRHLAEGLQVLETDLAAMDSLQAWRNGTYNRPLFQILDGHDARDFLRRVRADLLEGRLNESHLLRLIHLTLVTIHQDRRAGAREPGVPTP